MVLGLTTSGVVKVWTVGQQDLNNSGEPVLEHESKQIRCLNATSMTCCLYNQRTVIIVSPKSWQVSTIILKTFSSFSVCFTFNTFSSRFMMLAISLCYALCQLSKVNHGLAETS